MQLLSMPPSEKRVILVIFMKTGLVTLRAEVFSLAWLSVLMKSFASLVSRIAGLFYAPSRAVNKLTMR